MKTLRVFLVIAILIIFTVPADSCVGRVLKIGIVDSVNETVLAELISVLIDERTGTTVTVEVFNNPEEIYEAVQKEEIGVLIENTDNALSMLSLKGSGDWKKDYDVSKKEYRERLSLIWLKPFGNLPDEEGAAQLHYSPVITENVLINFPALPRVINKLNGISDDSEFGAFRESLESGGNIRKTVRDLLKRKKLI